MRSRPPVVALVILVLLQANPAVNWFAMRATARAARADHPTETHFVDSYVDSASYIIGIWSVLGLVVGAILVVLALLVGPGRQWAKNLLTIGLAGTIALALCGIPLNTGMALWTGPDEWDTIGDSVPVWQSPALLVTSTGLAIACCLAVILTWRRAAPSSPPPPESVPPPAPTG